MKTGTQHAEMLRVVISVGNLWGYEHYLVSCRNVSIVSRFSRMNTQYLGSKMKIYTNIITVIPTWREWRA